MNKRMQQIVRRACVAALAITMAGSTFAELPKSFVEYVDSNDGDTYIDTGVSVNPALTRMRVALALNTTSGATAVFGRGVSWGASNCAFVLMQNVQFRLDWLGDQNNKIDCVADKLYTFDLCGNAGTVNGVAYSTTVKKTNADSGENALLFSCYKNGIYAVAKMKLYSAAIWKDGTTLSGRYIPCIDNDDKAALYDMANDTIIYPKSKAGKDTPALTASTTPSSDFTIEDSTVKAKLTVVVNGTGGTTSEQTRWVAVNGNLTLTATPDAGMRAVWKVTRDGKTVMYSDASITVENVTAPLTAEVSFYPIGMCVTTAEFEAAVSTAQEGDTIYLASGQYDLTKTLTIDKGFTVQGAGRDTTILSAAGISGSRGAYLDNANATLKNLTVKGAYAKMYGAGVYINNGVLDTVRVTENQQNNGSGDNNNHGAGVFMMTGVITNSLVDYNSMVNASYHGTSGVGIFIESGLVVDSEIAFNTIKRTQHNGIGIYAKGGIIRHCRIHDNEAPDAGNNTYSGTCSSGDENKSSGHGAFLSGSAILENSLIYSNGICGVMMKGSSIMRNCAIYGHRKGVSDWFSGVNLAGGTLLNCTITDNYSSGESSGKAGLWMTGGKAINNIIWGNGAGGSQSCLVTGGTFQTNLTDNVSQENLGNFIASPGFVNAATNDFHLANGSKAIDAAADVGITTDIEGTARPQKNGYDIGCYEYVPSTAVSVSISVGQSEIQFGTELIATAAYENLDPTKATFTWTLKDGTGYEVETYSGLGAGYAEFSFEPKASGGYSLSLSVTYGGKTYAPADGAVTYTVKPTRVYVSNEGNSEAPYDNPNKATSDLNAALAALWQSADATTVVEVAAGEYALGDAIALAMPVKIEGAGRDTTIIHCGSVATDRRPFTCNNEGAVLRDLTLAGATNALTGVGSCARLEAGLIDNVRITATFQHFPSGSSTAAQAGGLYISGGVATNVLVDACTTDTNYGLTLGLGVYLAGGLLTDSVVCSNKLGRGECKGVGVCAYGGTVRRTKIFANSAVCKSDNAAYGVGLALYQQTASVQNLPLADACIVTGNTCGVYLHCGELRNSLVAGNCRSDGCVAGIEQVGGTVVHCTAADNVSMPGTTFDYSLTSAGTVRNTIAVAATISAGTSEANLFNVDPQFLAAAEGDYHLKAGSSAIDTAVYAGIDVDIEGTARPQKDGYDIGCYEYVPSMDVSVAIQSTSYDVAIGSPISASVAYENLEPDAATFTWTLKNATGEDVEKVTGTGTDYVAFSFVPETVGVYTLALSVDYEDETYVPEAGASTFTVKPFEVYVGNGGSSTAPYETPEKATTNLNAALAAVWQAENATSVVHVAAGTYELNGAVSLTLPVQIVGAGRYDTVIGCGGVPSSTRPFTINHAGAALADLTITGSTNALTGVTPVGSCTRLEAGTLASVRITGARLEPPSATPSKAAGLYLAGGVATNVLVDGCSSRGDYGWTQGLGVYMTGGLLVDSVVTSNSIARGECYGVGVFMKGGTILRTKIADNMAKSLSNTYSSGLALRQEYGESKAPIADSCEICDNTSAAYMNCGVIRNSLIVGGNRDDGRVAGLLQEGGTVVNCTIADNVSTGSETADYSLVPVLVNGVETKNPGSIKNSIAVNATVTSGTTANCLFNTDPKFVSPSSGIYRLKTSSPAIDKGDNAAWDWSDLETATDLMGAPRLINGVIDLGCYERPPIKGLLLMLK